jgi:hypothetical protein
MKVKIIKKYKDTELNRLVEIKEELEVTKKRGEQLIKAKVGIEIPEEKEEKNEETPKKKRVRKVASE